MRNIYSFILLLFIANISTLFAQIIPKKVLFLGNSYTAFNNLPAIVSAIASANGDSITYLAFTPGGQYFQAHADDPLVQTAFQQGDWDFIVAQEQSQIPVISYYRENLMYPGAASLKLLRDQYSPGASLIFFMTWGRQNGGQQCNGAYCSHTFTGFYDYQDTLTWAYYQTAVQNACGIAPVGEIWREAMLQHQTPLPPLSLFSTDGSHPSEHGSYLAALTIYSTLFNKLVSNIPYVYVGVDSQLDAFFKQITDANLWPRFAEWNLQALVSIFESMKTNNIPIVYPNPASESIFINLPESTHKVEVYTLNGRLHQTLYPQINVHEINLKSLRAGMYFIKIYTSNSVVQTKFVKQ